MKKYLLIGVIAIGFAHEASAMNRENIETIADKIEHYLGLSLEAQKAYDSQLKELEEDRTLELDAFNYAYHNGLGQMSEKKEKLLKDDVDGRLQWEKDNNNWLNCVQKCRNQINNKVIEIDNNIILFKKPKNRKVFIESFIEKAKHKKFMDRMNRE